MFPAEWHGLWSAKVEHLLDGRVVGVICWNCGHCTEIDVGVIKAPRLVLLDEPTAGLDLAARHDVWRRVERLAAGGAGVILRTHDLAEAERCSYVVLFAEGQIMAVGDPDKISARSSTATFLLYGIDARRLGDELGAITGVVAKLSAG